MSDKAQSLARDSDPDPTRRSPDDHEAEEWLAALHDVLREGGPERAHKLLSKLLEEARHEGLHPACDLTTAYVNTIPVSAQPELPDDPELEARVRSLVRWDAIAIVLQANAQSSELGGHIASYQSASTLYEVGFNHFWHAPSLTHGGDLVLIQGHSSPGIYARAYLEGRIDEDRLRRFRQEAEGPGLSSYPHPWLMPDFWQFPTVSMGLGPLMAIYQARFMKYLTGRGTLDTSPRKVWAFMGDGEMDEPESMGAISLAARERLDNLIFVVNCNLQRLDGPVRGNGKIIQELETNFRGAGWNVIKVIWGSRWDPLLAADSDGSLVRRMDEVLDGDYQVYKSRDGAFVREHFFGASPRLRAMVADLTDKQIWALNRGGHDPVKVHAAYSEAVAHQGQPTVILAKTIKGYGMGTAGEGQNITHQQKHMDDRALLAFRDRFDLPLTDEQVRSKAFLRPPEDSPEMIYLREHRQALGGPLPARRHTPARQQSGGDSGSASSPVTVPDLDAFAAVLAGSDEREISTTMAFVRVLATLLRDKRIGSRVVPIVPDESRTFGMEGMFRQHGIFSQVGQLYQPEDADQLMFYREDKRGQILQEGINEPGAMSSWIAAATSYSNHGVPMIPFYIFYSMFGFQRVGDLAWAAGDSRSRGFLIGATAGRTTLNGEGLQHEDGHSHLIASTIPNCVSYDPAYGYEVAVIVHDGLRRMLTEAQDVFFYITVMNENYHQPALPDGAREGILRGMHVVSDVDDPTVRLLGSGSILRETLAAGELLRQDFSITAQVWSVTSFSELARDAMEVERDNRLHPEREQRRTSYVQACLARRSPTGDDATIAPTDSSPIRAGSTPTAGENTSAPVPVVAASDYVRAVAEQIRPWIDAPYTVLGTDGFGRSDYRVALRRFFEVDRHQIVLAALQSLGRVTDAQRAIERYQIDTEGAPPWRR